MRGLLGTPKALLFIWWFPLIFFRDLEDPIPSSICCSCSIFSNTLPAFYSSLLSPDFSISWFLENGSSFVSAPEESSPLTLLDPLKNVDLLRIYWVPLLWSSGSSLSKSLTLSSSSSLNTFSTFEWTSIFVLLLNYLLNLSNFLCWYWGVASYCWGATQSSELRKPGWLSLLSVVGRAGAPPNKFRMCWLFMLIWPSVSLASGDGELLCRSDSPTCIATDTEIAGLAASSAPWTWYAERSKSGFGRSSTWLPWSTCIDTFDAGLFICGPLSSSLSLPFPTSGLGDASGDSSGGCLIDSVVSDSELPLSWLCSSSSSSSLTCLVYVSALKLISFMSLSLFLSKKNSSYSISSSSSSFMGATRAFIFISSSTSSIWDIADFGQSVLLALVPLAPPAADALWDGRKEPQAADFLIDSTLEFLENRGSKLSLTFDVSLRARFFSASFCRRPWRFTSHKSG